MKSLMHIFSPATTGRTTLLDAVNVDLTNHDLSFTGHQD